jgi:hypothetical protein
MYSFSRKTLALGASAILAFGFAAGAGAQNAQGGTGAAKGSQSSASTTGAGSEKTVEEAYLQESLETMVIKEQSQSDNKDMKLVALQYIKQAIDGGRKNEEIRKSLDYLALENSYTVVRSAGLGRPTNDFPDVRAKACDYLGEFPSVESKDTLLKVALGDQEPMVIAAAVRSLGKVGINDNDEVTQTISYIVTRFDILQPDNSLAFESLVALERIADKNGGIKDPAAIRAIMKIATGNYITPVKTKANDLLNQLRKYSAQSGTTGNGTKK